MYNQKRIRDRDSDNEMPENKKKTPQPLGYPRWTDSIWHGSRDEFL